MINYSITNNELSIFGIAPFSLERSCFCGQAFRWTTAENAYSCVLGRRLFTVRQDTDCIRISPCSPDDVQLLINYFDLERDYYAIEEKMQSNEVLAKCIPYASGIRVFNQEPFEALITFIISANNNIKRITQIVERLCVAAGDRLVSEDGIEYYTFPTPAQLNRLTIEQLHALGTGYRDRYIKLTTQAVCEGFPLEQLREMPYKEAKKQLCTLCGVGGKVADCVLLFSLGHREAFPIDVWIGRAVSTMFFNGETPSKHQLNELLQLLGNDAGIIQQYIFHFARETGLQV